MPAIQIETSIGAGVANLNLVSGSAFEIARSRSLISLGVTAAATGILVGITSGADLVLEESPAYIATQYPIVPDQMFYNDIMEPLDRLRISARNSSGGAVVTRALVLVTPL